MVYYANKISPQKIANFFLTMGAHCDTIWTVKGESQDTVAHPGTLNEWVEVANLYKLLVDCKTTEWGGAADKNDETNLADYLL